MQDLAISYHNNILSTLFLWCSASFLNSPPSSEKREQDRGSRQQDLRQQGLSKGGTTGGAVSIGRASMNQQPPTNSKFVKMLSDNLWYFYMLFKLRELLDINLILCILLEASGQASPSAGGWVSCMDNFACLCSLTLQSSIKKTTVSRYSIHLVPHTPA